jgi:hypothetical protein
MGMDGVIRFRDRGECIYFADQGVLKLYRPQSARRVGGRADERNMSGDIGFVLQAELPPEAERHRPVAGALSLSLCPIMNFPAIVRFSAVTNDKASGEFVAELRRHLKALPNTLAGIRKHLGSDFLDRSPLDRVSVLAAFLRTIPN